MNHHKKLSSQQRSEEQSQTQHDQQAQTGPVEFASVEEMLRHDALHTPVPPAIALRLQDSLAKAGSAVRPWWRRLFGGPTQ